MSKNHSSTYAIEAAHSVIILSMFVDINSAQAVRNKLTDIICTLVNININGDDEKFTNELKADIYDPMMSIFTGIHQQFVDMMENNTIDTMPDITGKLKEFSDKKNGDMIALKAEMLVYLDSLLKTLSDNHEHINYQKLPTADDVFNGLLIKKEESNE